MKVDDTKFFVFDLDGTLIKGNCSFSFVFYLVSKRALAFHAILYALFYYVKHVFLGMSLRKLHQRVFNRLLKGKPLHLFTSHADAFLDHYLPKNWYEPALCVLKEAQDLGHLTLLVSSSPSFLVSRIAKRLGVDAWHATEYAIDSEEKLCHIELIMEGTEKVAAVQREAQRFSIPLENAVVYSDSIEDEPLLSVAGTPIAVQPDRKLRALSQSREWKIL